MTRAILFERAARAQLGVGVDSLADAVKVTLGPRGRHVLLDRPFGSPTVTKDGATVAAEIDLPNPFADLGAQMVKEVASETSNVAGDGTTTAIVLAQALHAEGLKQVAAGASPMDLKRGVDAAVAVVVRELAEQSRPTRGRDDIARVATISANGDAVVGELIADAMERVGREGVVTVEEASSMETTLETVEGMQLDRGYLSPYFITDAARMEAVLEEPFVLVCKSKVSNTQQLLSLLEQVVDAAKPLLLVASEVEPEALATLVVNHLRGALAVCAVKAPGFGEQRDEILADGGLDRGRAAGPKDGRVSLDELTEEWGRSLERADGLARSGATDEAVALALVVYRATTDALVRANPHDRAIILGHVHRSRDELDRLRALHTAERERTAARSRAQYEAERRELAAPPRGAKPSEPR